MRFLDSSIMLYLQAFGVEQMLYNYPDIHDLKPTDVIQYEIKCPYCRKSFAVPLYNLRYNITFIKYMSGKVSSLKLPTYYCKHCHAIIPHQFWLSRVHCNVYTPSVVECACNVVKHFYCYNMDSVLEIDSFHEKRCLTDILDTFSTLMGNDYFPSECDYNFLDNIKVFYNPGSPGIDFYMNNNVKPMRRKFKGGWGT